MVDKPASGQFPARFPIKVIGYNRPEFAAVVREVLAEHLDGDNPAHFAWRASQGDRYLAFTITFMAHSRAQVEAIYQALNAQELVVMTL